MSIRTLLVDDEPLARRGLRLRLEALDGFDIVGEAGSGPEAVRLIHEIGPDLLFLDVQMPGMDGFDVLRALGAAPAPLTIFVTAHDTYALEAFQAHALDYLLKPVDAERFRQATGRARQLLRSGAEDVRRQMEALLQQVRPDTTRIVARDRGRVILLDPSDIQYVEAAGDYVTIHAGERGHLIRSSLQDMEARLAPAGFVRIHRSTLVAVGCIRSLSPRPGGDFDVHLASGIRLRMSRTHRDAVEAAIGHTL